MNALRYLYVSIPYRYPKIDYELYPTIVEKGVSIPYRYPKIIDEAEFVKLAETSFQFLIGILKSKTDIHLPEESLSSFNSL